MIEYSEETEEMNLRHTEKDTENGCYNWRCLFPYVLFWYVEVVGDLEATTDGTVQQVPSADSP